MNEFLRQFRSIIFAMTIAVLLGASSCGDDDTNPRIICANCKGEERLEKVYWLADGGIRRANSDGSDQESLIEGLPIAGGLSIDTQKDKIYWSDYFGGTIQRADADGSNVKMLISGRAWPHRIAIDSEAGKLYWTESFLTSNPGRILRADLDGTNVEELITEAENWLPVDIKLDPENGHMYWTDLLGKIQRATLEGTDVQDLVIGLGDLEGLALDLEAGKIYWVDSWNGKVQRADLTGSNVEDLVVNTDPLYHLQPYSIALDLDAGHIYWSATAHSMIRRAGLDGSNQEDLIDCGAGYILLALYFE